MDEEPLPPKIILFRKIINDVKKKILEKHFDDSETNDNRQDLTNLNDIQKRIIQLGHITKSLIEHPHTSIPKHSAVVELFKKNKFDFASSLSPSEKDWCLYYIDNDIFTYPYDLNTSHMDAASKKV
jgi:hypothetical protein